jgi:DNA-directed RNA polymerase subunit RPC12/RpoP
MIRIFWNKHSLVEGENLGYTTCFHCGQKTIHKLLTKKKSAGVYDSTFINYEIIKLLGCIKCGGTSSYLPLLYDLTQDDKNNNSYSGKQKILHCIKCDLKMYINQDEIPMNILCHNCDYEYEIKVDGTISIINYNEIETETVCYNCGITVELEEYEIKDKKYTCPKCNYENYLEIELAENKRIENLSIENEFTCSNCGLSVELEEDEIKEKKYICPDCGYLNKVEFKNYFVNLNVKCELCSIKLEITENEYNEGKYLCPNCKHINLRY